jgi:hypothetical protein
LGLKSCARAPTTASIANSHVITCFPQCIPVLSRAQNR